MTLSVQPGGDKGEESMKKEERVGSFGGLNVECSEATSTNTRQKQIGMKIRNECEGKAAQVRTPVSPKVHPLTYIFSTPPCQARNRHSLVDSPGKNTTSHFKILSVLLT